MRTWLSIDWDFFVRERDEWDWQHGESTFMRDAMWPSREAGFLARGMNLRNEMDPRTHSEPTPTDFWRALTRHGYDFTGAHIVVADSHRFAADTFINGYATGFDTQIVHFDAHHDLGYDYRLVKKHVEMGQADCGDWQFMTLRHYPQVNSLIVYPAWKGLEEWDSTYGAMLGRRENSPYRKRVKAVVWPDPAIEERASSVACVFLCRSGAWTPPWLDPMFIEMVQELSERTGTEVQVPYEEYEQCNPMVPREDNAEAAKSMAEVLRLDPDELAQILKKSTQPG